VSSYAQARKDCSIDALLGVQLCAQPLEGGLIGLSFLELGGKVTHACIKIILKILDLAHMG
jgi:hypothetical protein